MYDFQKKASLSSYKRRKSSNPFIIGIMKMVIRIPRKMIVNMYDFKEKTGSSSDKRHKSPNPLIIGMITTAVTVSLVLLIASPILERSNSARYVASFIAGLFGYTAIETLRRSLD